MILSDCGQGRVTPGVELETLNQQNLDVDFDDPISGDGDSVDSVKLAVVDG